MNERTEKANFRELENRTFRKAENYIIRITKRTEKWNADKSVKNEFFIRKTKTADKKKFIIFLKNASSFFMLFFSKSRNSERVKKAIII